MRIGFAGTPAFAAAALEAILAAEFSVSMVLTRPDLRQGRGMKLQPGPVKALAAARGLPLQQPVSVKDPAACARIAAIPLDVLVVAAYGQILPKAILTWPRHGCINIHASLLPRWRGAAPIQRALLAGDAETGISIMRMDVGLDTGPLITRHPVPITAHETGGSLHDKLAAVGAQAIVAVLRQLDAEGNLRAEPQAEAGATYAAKIARAETVIDWRQSARAIDLKIRAFNPAPGARTSLAGETVKLWAGSPAPAGSGPPGTVLGVDASGIVVACGEGAFKVTTLQRPGARSLSAAAFRAGHRIATGMRLGASD